MKSDFNVLDAICSWCREAKECVPVELESGQKMDLCWSCLKTKANAESGGARKTAKRRNRRNQRLWHRLAVVGVFEYLSPQQ